MRFRLFKVGVFELYYILCCAVFYDERRLTMSKYPGQRNFYFMCIFWSHRIAKGFFLYCCHSVYGRMWNLKIRLPKSNNRIILDNGLWQQNMTHIRFKCIWVWGGSCKFFSRVKVLTNLMSRVMLSMVLK